MDVVPNGSVCTFFQPQLKDDFLNDIVSVLSCAWTWEAQVGSIAQGFPDGQGRYEYILLHDICTSNTIQLLVAIVEYVSRGL